MLRGYAQTLVGWYFPLEVYERCSSSSETYKGTFNTVLLTFWVYKSGVFKAHPIIKILKLSKSWVSLCVFWLCFINSSCLKINKKENLAPSQKALESAAQNRRSQAFNCAICDIDL